MPHQPSLRLTTGHANPAVPFWSATALLLTRRPAASITGLFGLALLVAAYIDLRPMQPQAITDTTAITAEIPTNSSAVNRTAEHALAENPVARNTTVESSVAAPCSEVLTAEGRP